MQDNKRLEFINNVLKNMPKDWLYLTTHRLDIYDEEVAKTQFLEEFDILYTNNTFDTLVLNNLPTAYDYIRLGHPLSSIVEWYLADLFNTKSDHVISFASKTVPILAVLRKNSLENKSTQITYTGTLPSSFDSKVIQHVYGYDFELVKVNKISDIVPGNGSTVYVGNHDELISSDLNPNIDFYVATYQSRGSVLLVNGTKNREYIADIQHVRRRETIAMTPANCLAVLESFTSASSLVLKNDTLDKDKPFVLNTIREITGSPTKPLVGSSGLSIQYAIMMGLVDDARQKHEGKAIKFIVPPNCYGGTNDQARRVAACIDAVEVVDLPVDGDNDMVRSIALVLDKIANEDAIPYIIAEIPTNPRVEVPDLMQLKKVLSTERKTAQGTIAIDPVFILDQTFCPNVQFLGEGEMLSTIRALSYASGSKFPSGGKCTAGYCVGNIHTKSLMDTIAKHLIICDNEATHLQYEILAKQLPSMNQRILDAYKNTREMVNFIKEVLPDAKINFVSEALADQGFTPSVFSLDLPTKGTTAEEKEAYKRALNLKLINLMITKIPQESKYCVSYGQLKGCYWTIPATSTQGTTKEGDKDYIARVALSPNMDLEHHKQVFLDFVKSL
ncbi:cystathionine beta-synthase [Aquimarina sp. W85]|uniref:cystathionine beta-synthase n=1 Tax=Aquimarina rhodophyticola TaxID=3342246 RepID=UPI0036703C9D